MRHIVSLLCSIALALCFAVVAYADPIPETPIGDEIGEEYQYTSDLSSILSINNRVASCKSKVYGFSGIATKVEITHTLQKQVYGYWSDVETWSGTYYTWYGILTSSRSNLSAGMFRLKTVAKVYSGSNYETITVYSDQVSSVG